MQRRAMNSLRFIFFLIDGNEKGGGFFGVNHYLPPLLFLSSVFP